jgi:hypothetical protein
MIVEESEYQGKPVLVIKIDEKDRFPFTFGLSKARKILNSIEDIKKFVEKHDKPNEE